MVCVSRSRLGLWSLAHFCIKVLPYSTGGNLQSSWYRNGSGSHATSDTSRHKCIENIRPLNLVVRTLRSVEHICRHIAPNLISIQRPRRLLEIDHIWHTCSMSPCQVVDEWVAVFFARYLEVRFLFVIFGIFAS